VVLRDYQSQFISASCKCIPHLSSAMMAEEMAMKEGFILANSKELLQRLGHGCR
jgi:hypothetical protein